MKTSVQWLLIGGPSHGVTVWVSSGGRILYGGETYEGENYHCGLLYRIGVHFCARPIDRANIPDLIRSTRLQPL